MDGAGVDITRLKRLLFKLIDIYSPSGKEEDLLDYLYGYLKRQDLPVEKQEVDDNRYNLVVAPPEVELALGLVGHVDTVVAYDLDSYQHELDNGEVFGLGAADMKAGLAAMIEAYVGMYKSSGRRPPVALCLVVGEEEDGDGATRLVKDYQFPWAVIGEPTDMVPCLSNYGYIELQLTTKGRRRHASLPKQGLNPIESMLGLVSELVRYFREVRPELVYNVRDMFSSQAGFFVPDYCEAWFDVHTPPAANVGEIMQEFEDLISSRREEVPALEAGIRFATIDTGFELPEKGPVVEALKNAFSKNHLPWNPAAFRSHSDATRLWEAGIRPILVGPGQLEKAHSPDESVRIEQVVQAASMYRDLAQAMAAPEI